MAKNRVLTKVTRHDPETDIIEKKKKKQDYKRKKKLEFRRIKRRLSTSKKKPRQTSKHKSVQTAESVRTFYEKQYEAYCRLLGQPVVIDHVFCFTCGNFYWYGDHPSFPKRCQVCHVDFTSYGTKPAYLARPDFIIDFNNVYNRRQYKRHCMQHDLQSINKYRTEYMKKVGVVRIDGGIHNAPIQRQKDYKQWLNFMEKGVKLFIVTNDDIDEMLDKGDNGKGLLELCKAVGDAIIDEGEYMKYTQSPNFVERTRKPVVL